MWADWIVIGTLWFWIICGFEFCLLGWFICGKDSGWSAFTSLMLFMLILVLFGNLHPIDWLMDHPKEFAIRVVIYFAAGVPVAMLKLRSKASKAKKKFFEKKAAWIERNCKNSDTDSARDLKWQDFLLTEMDNSYSDYALPNYEDYKNDVMYWMTWWVFVIIDVILSDLIRKIWNIIYDLFGGIYKSLFNYVLKDVKAEHDTARAYAAVKKQQPVED